ncbi:MAG: metal-dependent hydrolase [Candidatus Micrarchaeota archaeon]|nr:metal-dependent hydrolase [Candidatus Micrarchaeota archaeon]
MKTGFGLHLFIAICALLALALAIREISPELIAAGGLFLAGSVAPDVDHPNSKIRRITEVFVFAIALSLVLFLSREMGAYSIPFSILVSFGAVKIAGLLIPGHRKFMHSAAASAVFGICIAAICAPFAGSWGLAWGLAGACGYLLHMAVDRAGDIL